MNRSVYIAVLVLLSSCTTSSKADTDRSYTDFAARNSALIEEMAGYSLLFCQDHTISSFEVKDVADRETRKKLFKLGRVFNVFYKEPARYGIDSTVVFKTVSIPNGVLEYIFDFAVYPRKEASEASEASTRDNALVRVSDRVYYRRRPFPFM